MHGRSLVRQRPAWQRRGRFSVDGGRSRVVADERTRQHIEGEGDMKTSLLSLATAVLLASSVHAAFLPPANNWKSSLTFPTPASGADFKITQASQAQVVVSTGNITFKLKLSGVIDNNMAGVPATQAGNTYQVDLRYRCSSTSI